MIRYGGSNRLPCVLPRVVRGGSHSRSCIASIGVCGEDLLVLDYGCDIPLLSIHPAIGLCDSTNLGPSYIPLCPPYRTCSRFCSYTNIAFCVS